MQYGDRAGEFSLTRNPKGFRSCDRIPFSHFEPARLACRENTTTVFRAHFTQNAVNVAFDGFFGEIQTRGDLLICESIAQEGDEFLLSARKRSLGSVA